MLVLKKKWMHNANVLALPAVLKNQWGYNLLY